MALSELDLQFPKFHRNPRAPSSSPPPLGEPRAATLVFRPATVRHAIA
jgi:hypothetical protein